MPSFIDGRGLTGFRFMTILFLFGAGASYGNPDCIPHPPPLGGQLLDALRVRGGVAASIDDELIKVFRNNFEEGMAEFFRTRNVEVTSFQREMAEYFCQFEPGPNNFYRRIIDILGGTEKKAVFATTNYDLLIELSINRSGFMVSYTNLPVPERNVSVLKIHGSCNFLPALQSRQIQGIGFEVPESVSILEAPIRVATPHEVREFCQREDSIAPAIALYAKGKSVLHCPSFVKHQQEFFKIEIYRASKIFIIGLRVNHQDHHIWVPLSNAKGKLFYIGREPNEFRQWLRSVNKKNGYILADTFEESLPLIKRRIYGH